MITQTQLVEFGMWTEPAEVNNPTSLSQILDPLLQQPVTQIWSSKISQQFVCALRFIFCIASHLAGGGPWHAGKPS